MADGTHFVGPVDRLLFMKTITTLEGVDNEHLALIARTLTERRFNRGEKLIERGRVSREVYVIVTGRVEMRQAGRVIAHAGPGDNVGLVHALAESDELEAVAEVDTLVLNRSTDIFLELFSEHFQLLQNALRQLARYHHALLEETIEGSVRAPWEERTRIRIPDRDLDVVEKLVILRGGEIFQQIGMEALAMMATGLQQERWSAGTTLWETGDPSGYLLLLLKGEVEGRLADGSFRAGRGYPLGNIETMAENPRWYDAVATTDLVTLRGNHEALFDVLEDDFDVALQFLRSMAAGVLRAGAVRAERLGPLDSPVRYFRRGREEKQPVVDAAIDQPQ